MVVGVNCLHYLVSLQGGAGRLQLASSAASSIEEGQACWRVVSPNGHVIKSAPLYSQADAVYAQHFDRHRNRYVSTRDMT